MHGPARNIPASHVVVHGRHRAGPASGLKCPARHVVHTRSLVAVGAVVCSSPTPHTVSGAHAGLTGDVGLHTPCRYCTVVSHAAAVRHVLQTVSVVVLQAWLTYCPDKHSVQDGHTSVPAIDE